MRDVREAFHAEILRLPASAWPLEREDAAAHHALLVEVRQRSAALAPA
ncbi:MAG: hypothetical protein HYT85_12210 [candidate division NC10 bacterium]|nr:hypothetical protein [candidate division NC10 bacterium]